MSKHEKAPYEKLAKEEKFRAKEQAKQAGTGESIDLIEKLEREKLEFFENMKENITRVLSNAKATNSELKQLKNNQKTIEKIVKKNLLNIYDILNYCNVLFLIFSIDNETILRDTRTLLLS